MYTVSWCMVCIILFRFICMFTAGSKPSLDVIRVGFIRLQPSYRCCLLTLKCLHKCRRISFGTWFRGWVNFATRIHEHSYVVVGDRGFALLERFDKPLQSFDTLCLQLTCEQPASSVLFCQPRIFFVVIVEEPKILIRDIHIGIPAQPPMFLLSLLAPAEPMSVNLVLDLTRSIGHVDRAVRVRGAHLGPRALQRREELGVQERRFGVSEFSGDVARESEIWVLVNCAGDKRRDVVICAEYVWVGVGEGCSSLDGGEVDFTDVVGVVESKCRFRLTHCDPASYSDDVLVKGAAYIVKIAEYKGLFWVEADGNNVSRVLS